MVLGLNSKKRIICMNNKLSYLKSFLNLNTRRLTILAIPLILGLLLAGSIGVSGNCINNEGQGSVC